MRHFAKTTNKLTQTRQRQQRHRDFTFRKILVELKGSTDCDGKTKKPSFPTDLFLVKTGRELFLSFFVFSVSEVMLKWASEENTWHLSVVAQGSVQRLSSATSSAVSHPSFWQISTRSDEVTRGHERAQQSGTRIQRFCTGVFFYSSILCRQQKGLVLVFILFPYRNLHLHLNKQSCGLFTEWVSSPIR